MNAITATAILTTAVVDLIHDPDLVVRNVEFSRDADHDVDAEPDDYTITGDLVADGVTVAYVATGSHYPHAVIDWREGF